MGMIESKHRATSDPDARKQVLKEIEKQKVAYVLDGIREAILDGAGLSTMWDEIWPLLLIGAVAAPVGLWVFRRGEIYAKKHGKLKRSG